MGKKPPLSQIGDICVFRPVGSYRLQEILMQCTAAIAEARELGHKKMLVATLGATGFPSPSLSKRHQMAREWAEAARGKLCVAFVVRPDYIDPEKFGVVSALNFGLTSDVFSVEAEAMLWLESQA